MLIKEYRIPMPMSVDEYRIAQLYMIQKKSREESCGEGSGVEILLNRPYQDGPGGSGQYTLKVYHIGKHIPSWFCAVLPPAALRVEEESWNAYPYTRTRYTCPFVEKFSIDMETFYRPDHGQHEDVFPLTPAETRLRTVDLIDIVRDPVAPHEYLPEEDPGQYRSLKTGRGPLSEDWLLEVGRDPGQDPGQVMCAYKLCKVEFRYWGMQSKIERFIHDVGLRKVMVRAHRQAWCWQDEWFGLTMEDVRRLELETQLALAQKMRGPDQTPEDQAERGASASTEDRGDGTEPWGPDDSSLTGGGSDESADDEFFDAHEDLAEDEWSPRDKIPAVDPDQAEGERDMMYLEVGGVSEAVKQVHGSLACPLGQEVQRGRQTSKIQVLLLVLHGGNFLDSEQSSDGADVQTLTRALRSVMRVHYPAARDRLAVRTVPCPRVCVEASALVSNLSPRGHERSRPRLGPDRARLAALLATSAPQYQVAVATVVQRANQVFHDFISSPEGTDFSGQVCVLGDSVGGVLGFDVLCCSSVSDSPVSSRRGSSATVQGLVPLSHLDLPLSDWSTSGVVERVGTVLDSPGRLDFEVLDFFLLGSPLGLVLALRRTATPSLDVSALRPACRQLYNLFHPRDPSASRLEPLLDPRFHLLPPFVVPRDQTFPPDDGGLSPLLAERVRADGRLPTEVLDPGGTVTGLRRPTTQTGAVSRHIGVEGRPRPSDAPLEVQRAPPVDVRPQHRPSLLSHLPLPRRRGSGAVASPRAGRRSGQVFPRSDESLSSDLSSDPTSDLTGLTSDLTDISSYFADLGSPPPSPGVLRDLEQVAWWGSKRLDYALDRPDAALPSVHPVYWDSCDVASFLLRQVMRQESGGAPDHGAAPEVTAPVEKWLRRRTHVKIRNLAANHRGNDVVFAEGGAQGVAGRFMYGPLDMVTLAGERVDVRIMTRPPSGDWVHFGTGLTSSSGRVSVLLPESRRLGAGVYPVQMVVRGDGSWACCYLTVVPRGTSFVVFSIDGSFAASVSIMGGDPKVRAGSADVVRFWQDRGHLIVYVTGRPDLQKQRVVSWLSQHNFPHGVVSFCDGLVHDPRRHKANFLKALVSEAHMSVAAAYGSNKDLSVYSSVGLTPAQIYIVGRPGKRTQHQCQFISDGYVSHLAQLQRAQLDRAQQVRSSQSAVGGDLLWRPHPQAQPV